MEAHPRDQRSPQAPLNLANPSAHPPVVESAVPAPRTGTTGTALEPAPLAATQRHYLNEGELANRWGLSQKTLQRWRGIGVGPVFVKFSRRVAYPLESAGGILDHEERSRYRSTSERIAPGGAE